MLKSLDGIEKNTFISKLIEFEILKQWERKRYRDIGRNL
jgi:hypothetical protein